MDDYRRRSALRICEQHRRGLITADDACCNILFFRVEPALAADYVGLLPVDLRAALSELLPTLPVSDDGWASFRGVGQIDGDEQSWLQMIVDCRANTEAVREYLSGEASPPAAADFVDRVRQAYRDRLDELRDSFTLRQQRHAEPGAAPDTAGM